MRLSMKDSHDQASADTPPPANAISSCSLQLVSAEVICLKLPLSLQQDLTFKNTKFTEFDLSKVRDEVTSDRRKLKSTMTMDISNMKHVQVGAKTTHFEKVIEGDNMLTNLTKCGQQYSSGGEVSAQGKFIESGDPTCFTVQLE
uniref:Lipocln_cytosolic_FA-bd_dom domain-containing protein n=1 Tax=Mesocestoides corti TaxID=53468 RepID=A0A5K3G003_MESCO